MAVLSHGRVTNESLEMGKYFWTHQYENSKYYFNNYVRKYSVHYRSLDKRFSFSAHISDNFKGGSLRESNSIAVSLFLLF